jgi:phosphatidylinositol alpha-1,6-mannosyltransferase
MKANRMSKPEAILYTLDYPPERGGVARYLGSLVAVSGGRLRVVVPETHAMDGAGAVVARRLLWGGWPKWLPSVFRIRAERVPVLVSHVFPLGTAAWITSFFGGPRYAVLFHGLDLRLATGGRKRWLLRRIAHRASHLFVNSRATAEALAELVPDAVATVATPGVDLPADLPSREASRRRLGSAANDIVLLSVCRAVPRKGIDRAIEAVAVLEDPRLRLVVVGDGPERAAWEALAKNRGVRAEFHPRVADADLPMFYAAADIFILPVIPHPRDMEGFGIVLLEAAAAGLPAIVGRDGGTAEAVVDGQTGIVVDGNDPAAVAAAVRRLAGDAGLRSRMGESGRARALREFRWDRRWDRFAAGMGLGFVSSDISVVIPVFNHADEIGNTLRAIAAQAVRPREIVIVDDGSSDGIVAALQREVRDLETESVSADVVRRFRADRGAWRVPAAPAIPGADFHGVPVRFLRLAENAGAPVARNIGVSVASGSRILCLDADAELVPDALLRMDAALDADPEASFAYGDFFWGRKRFRGRAFDATALRKGNWIHTSALMRREAFPGFDPELKKFQDWDLWWTMAENGLRGAWIPSPLFRIAPRRRGSGMSDWLPAFAHRLPWPVCGWIPKTIRKHRAAEAVLRARHAETEDRH